MDIKDFYQTHYFHESARRDQINNSLTIPLGIISLISGGALALAKELDVPFDNFEIFQLIFLVMTSLFLILSSVFLGKAYWGYGYAHMPRTKQLQDYHQQLIYYYLNLGNSQDFASNLASNDVSEYIASEYANNSDTNAFNNDKKSANLFKANTFMMASLLFLFFSALPYVIDEIKKPTETHKIEVVNLKEISMTIPAPQSPVNSLSHQSTPVISVPPKPTPPPSVVVKEHVEPVKTK
jgi:hypothetical protein